MKKSLIIILVIASAVGIFTGWSFTKSREKAKSDEKGQIETIEQDSSQSIDLSEGGKYLVIKEWGIRYPVPETIQGDLIYGVSTIKNPQPGQDNTIIYIASKKLASLSKACGLTAINDTEIEGSFGGHYAVSRTTSSVDENGNTLTITDGVFWYSAQKTNASCAASSSDDEIINYERKFTEAIGSSKMLSSVEVIE